MRTDEAHPEKIEGFAFDGVHDEIRNPTGTGQKDPAHVQHVRLLAVAADVLEQRRPAKPSREVPVIRWWTPPSVNDLVSPLPPAARNATTSRSPRPIRIDYQ